ncbi:TraR/DksA C4-type zinc finger protein [Agriterribacter sp.]|uniref:TraR/DksA family transcriptional regulator n=1 Tax=Agriterribacter sp. TaxID=2821509 RepID=UPI002BA34A6F|nr:TraR/DksA C4-type zinc finger protein [Agriterribacter sp.]HRO46605.1 TraR/DksA C4-type zinc finger protein [Agriterribacter sp.]HRQ19442.1 TraR/DksA C4-type zinc finger protein [Agriterribacter sp.]
MAPNKKAAKKATAHKAKPAKAAPKKAVKAAKPAPKKAAKPVKQAKSAKAVAHKPVAKKAVKKASAKKPVSPKAPVKPVTPVKKATHATKHEPAKKAVKEVPAAPTKQLSPKFEQIKKVAKAQVEKTKPGKPVVIPKLSTNQARKYEPEFTQSVLDRPAVQQSGPTMKYSDAELIEFKELILRKLEAAKKELNYLQGLITRKDDMGGDESENRYMTMEDGSISMEREQLSQMASRQIQYIDHLEKAMMRIENKTYGICRVTGKLIDKARLRAVPHATLSIEAKMGFAKNPNIQ